MIQTSLKPSDVVVDTWYPEYGRGVVESVGKGGSVTVNFKGRQPMKYDRAHTRFLRHADRGAPE